MSDTTESNPIYSYRASEELDTDSWGTLVRAVNGIHAPDLLKQQFTEWENDYRGSTGLPLPNAWRSAKSVIVRASKASVSITTDDGTVRGKTAVENEIKSGKPVVDVDPEEKFTAMLAALILFGQKHGLDWQAQLEAAAS